MFRLAMPPTFSARVSFQYPLTPDQQGKGEFTAHYKRLSVSESDALARRASDEQWTDARLVAELIVGWEGITDAHDVPLPYSADALTQLLEIPGIARAVLEAHRRARDGAPLGN